MSITRRGFLEACGGVCAAAAIGGTLTGCAGEGASSAGSAEATTTTSRGYCRMCMMGRCGNVVTMEDGVVTRVTGDPEAAVNKGRLCPRGNSAIMNLYNPHRIKSPLKRTNPEKGLDVDPQWEEISWDEAFDIVGEKLKAIHDSDPRKLIFSTGFGMMDYFVTAGPFFALAFGTPNWIQANGPLCSVHYMTETIMASFPGTTADYIHGEYVVWLGHTAGATFCSADGDSQALVDAIERGMEMVVIDPRASGDSALGEWVPILPGADTPFLLGMFNSMLFEVGVYDEEFLTKRSNAPYLIGADGDYVRGENGKPMMWDETAGAAKEFDQDFETIALEGAFDVNGAPVKTGFTLVKEAMAQFTPDWASGICQIPADTIRRIARDFVDHAHIGETIEIDGTVMPLRPVCIMGGPGSLNHQDGTYGDMVSKLICELVGAMDVPGGLQGCNYGPVLAPNEDGLVQPVREALGECEFAYPPNHLDLSEYFPYRHAMPYMLYQNLTENKLVDFDYEPEMLFVAGGNSIVGCTEPEMIAKAISSLPFVACIAYHMDEVALLSDVVFPEPAMLERTSINANGGPAMVMGLDNAGVQDVMFREGVPPLYDTKHAHEIMMELLDRAGALPAYYEMVNHACMLGEVTNVVLREDLQLEAGKRYEITDIWDRALKSEFGDDKGLDYAREHGFIENRLSLAECYNYMYFPEGQTRYQFYLQSHLMNGRKIKEGIHATGAPDLGLTDEVIDFFYDAVPHWKEPPALHENAEYPLHAFRFKTPEAPFRLGGCDDNAWLVSQAADQNPYHGTVLMHPDAAAEQGLADGDRVVVESKYGSTKGNLYVTKLVHPQSVGFGGAVGRLAASLGVEKADLPNFNSLLGARVDDIDITTGGVDICARVSVRKA
ncbi:molybdopterin-dependent oxidoreductase [Eggerthella sp. YY7918]|uniref:molybdopterin-dependent oxidoreductase n=1 Tax=Eggerthella sp. (strain YY7918) TaxID=502558 RepID=UPI0002171588|nr:molybdopterin-dependent oxidoreductase [Eggerthella sp. YY7918]BAK44954.1 anaerobic dehydrogenase [Eggerthella sp. YY7918]